MLTPYQLPFLIRYFDGIDAAVSRRLSRLVPPTETTLTQEFCALMDAAAQRREKSLTFDADALQEALAKPGDMVDVEFTIEVHQHGQRLEAFVSQADFGLILEYENTVLPNLNWRAAYLMQAKRLFPDPGGSYSIASTFASTSPDQQQRLQDLVEILGKEGIRSWLYMPSTDGYEAASSSAIRNLHARNVAGNIFDYALGLALRDELQRSGGIDAGMWVADLAVGTTAADVHTNAFVETDPFTWFILQHFGRLSSHSERSTELHVESVRRGGSVERVARIAAGDRLAAQELIDELGDKARDKKFDPGTMTVLPGQSVTIRVRSGPPDGVDLPVSRDDRG